MSTPTPWPSAAAFDDDHRAAVRAERGGEPEPMTARSRMDDLDRRGVPPYPGAVREAGLRVGRESDSLHEWADREAEARTVTRRETLSCGCTIGRNSAGGIVRVISPCGPLSRCNDEPWRRAHIERGVPLEDADGQPKWSWLSSPPA